MGHMEKCLVRTPWADRSSTSAALCCCHCYSKSLCLDHCGQRERQVRATQPRTTPAPSKKKSLLLEKMTQGLEDTDCSYSCIRWEFRFNQTQIFYLKYHRQVTIGLQIKTEQPECGGIHQNWAAKDKRYKTPQIARKRKKKTISYQKSLWSHFVQKWHNTEH